MTHKHWTPDELSYIKEKYPTVEAKTLAKRLRVTESQIRVVALKYNLKKRAAKKSSTNAEQHPYMRGYSFWKDNIFWRTGMYKEETKAMLDNWLEEMRMNERSLTRLSA